MRNFKGKLTSKIYCVNFMSLYAFIFIVYKLNLLHNYIDVPTSVIHMPNIEHKAGIIGKH